MKIDRVTIKSAENGFTVTKHFEQTEEGKYAEPVDLVFNSVDAMLEGVRDCFKSRSKAKTKVLSKIAENTAYSRS